MSSHRGPLPVDGVTRALCSLSSGAGRASVAISHSRISGRWVRWPVLGLARVDFGLRRWGRGSWGRQGDGVLGSGGGPGVGVGGG